MYKSATLENDDIIDLPKIDISTTQELKNIDPVDINLNAHEFKEDTFGDRLRKSRIELVLSISEITELCGVTKSVISGYELNRYVPTKEVLNLLSSKFDMNYICVEGYTKLLYNFDEFLDKLKLRIDKNNYTRLNAANKLSISPSLFRFWFNRGTISISTYNRIKNNLNKFQLL
ncbi:helix-turn-helix transcriptional regulator [Romboutsia sp. 1001216sp1]|uniref:helix-turn-helix domain-containing protein n=1 Tax=unclassified Romboutsia TaxID=2626894 RepID=UPI0018A97154|nr:MULTISPECIES: helix-turn-helix transcriptional regulator [unclassified Romboutsia]MDB8794608.1 helix-turn-helix transcriptional regulator [Romboutsia sp. 1001216sp1]MDB8796562.1 helix-turn-helix transcriptional regulator [Romboutsia sp. 1001216sp1]MDB8798040.1 helix-turn-helix transcriptional regulator [Romboutsia sp. 1001216sp1]